ncbi:MAG: hypothetical protein ACXWEJ_09825 [Actinomycetota bacterium]
MLDHLGIGVYRLDGTVVLAGSESGQDDFWLYDFQVPILERMAQAPPVAFSEFAAYLQRHGIELSTNKILAVYADAFAAHADAFLPQLLEGLDLTLQGDPEITSLEEYLLLLDAVVPPNQGGAQTEFGVDSAGTLAADAACAFPGGGNPAGWGLTYKKFTAKGGSSLGPLAMEGVMLPQSISANVARSPGTIHEGHGGPGGVKQITVSVSANFASAAPACGFPTSPYVPSFPLGPTPLVLDVVWRFDPVAYEHGDVVRVAPASIPNGLTKTLGQPFAGPGEASTDIHGEAAVQYRAREEPSDGKGTFDSSSVNVGIELQHIPEALAAAGYPKELTIYADAPYASQLTGFELSWHTLDQHWSGTVKASSHTEFHAYGSYLVCTENWNLTLSFTVDESGSIAGSGTGDFDSLKGCRSNIGWEFNNAKTLAFDVKGTETDSELDLQFYETAIDGKNEGLLNHTMFFTNAFTAPVLAIPRVGVDRAEGTVTISTTVDNGQTADGSHLFSLTCADCQPTP